MSRPAQITREVLAPLLRSRGPVSATELAAALRVNRTTIVRTLPNFGADLLTLGATRSSRYLLRRSIRNAGNRWPIYRIDASGRASQWAALEAFYEHHWRILWLDSPPAWERNFLQPNGLWHGFPFFLGEMRPGGFLGKAVARQLSGTLQLPEDPARWSDDDTLIFLEAAGEDVPGNLVVGDECLRRGLADSAMFSENNTVSYADRSSHYPRHAEQATRVAPGSSARGDHPKFLTTVRHLNGDLHSVLVKFSARMDQPVGERWADLLLCEFYALEVLAEAGLARPGARILDAENRRFLEVPRFDRCAGSGRQGVISLAAIQNSALDSYPRHWPEAAAGLLELGLIDQAAVEIIQRLHAFGELIGNSDMHAGNLAFWMDDSLPFRVAPSYDMLPMLWAPSNQGEMGDRPFRPLPPIPATRDLWRSSALLAEEFWRRTSEDERLSARFSPIAADCLEKLKNLRSHVG